MRIDKVKVETSVVEREWIAAEISQLERGLITGTEAADAIIKRIKEKLILRLNAEITGTYEDFKNGYAEDIEDVVMATETAIEVIAYAEED
jgi:hypothetical protein